MPKYTLADIKAMDRDMLTPAIVGPVLGMSPYDLTLMARYHPEKIPFPFIVNETRTKIPRLAFIRWMEGEEDRKRSREESNFSNASED